MGPKTSAVIPQVDRQRTQKPNAGPSMSNQRIQNTSGHVTNERPSNPKQKTLPSSADRCKKAETQAGGADVRKESRLQQKYYDRVHKKNTTFIVPAAVIAELIGSFLAQRSNAVWRVELHARAGVGELSSFHSERRRGAIEKSGNTHEPLSQSAEI